LLSHGRDSDGYDSRRNEKFAHNCSFLWGW
jgi:hypothetical protein